MKEANGDGRGSVEAGDAGVQNRVKEAGAQKSTVNQKKADGMKRSRGKISGFLYLAMANLHKGYIQTICSFAYSFGISHLGVIANLHKAGVFFGNLPLCKTAKDFLILLPYPPFLLG